MSQTEWGSLLAYHPQEYSPSAILQQPPLRLVLLLSRFILPFFASREGGTTPLLWPPPPCKSSWVLLSHAPRLLQVPPWLPVNSPPLLVSCSVQLHSHLWVSHGRTLCLHTPHHSALLQLHHLSMGAGTEGLQRLAVLKLTWEIRGRSSLL